MMAKAGYLIVQALRSDLLWLLLVAIAYGVLLRWIYVDAKSRLGEGLSWLIAGIVLPVISVAFYLVYRNGSLIRYDQLEKEKFLTVESPELKLFYLRQNPGLFKILMKSLKEYPRKGIPLLLRSLRIGNGRKDHKKDHKLVASKKAVSTAEVPKVKREPKRPKEAKRRDEKEIASTVEEVEVPPRASEARKNRLSSLLEDLENMPGMDNEIEDMLFRGELDSARERARDNLVIAQEMLDKKMIKTYETYLDRITRLLRGRGTDRETIS